MNQGQTKLEAYLSTLEIDNGRGSQRFCTLTSNVLTDISPVVIELNSVSMRIEINGIELTADQRRLLIKFLKQKD